jgi:hypothetical protein
MQKTDPTWYAFLAMTFAVVGLTGMFASFAAPLPLARMLARDAALNEAQAALTGSDPAAAIETLRPRLGDSAAALLPLGGDMTARIAAERGAMHARLQAEADATATRLRVLIGIVTVVGAVFGGVVMGASRRTR